MQKSKEFLEYAVKCIVSNHGAVKVEAVTDEMGVLLTLRVAADEMGKIIGTEGTTAKALRTLLRSVGRSENARVNLKIEDPPGRENFRRQTKRDSFDDNFTAGVI